MKRLLCLLLLACCVGPPVFAQPAERPNVVLMMADDLAYADLSCYGSKTMRTPRLDALAGEGMRLTGFYAGATICTPSRMALMAGAYPARLGWQKGVVGHLMENNTGLSGDVVTVAELFRSAGYFTAISGKWHLGEGDLRPERQGFDSAYYIFRSNNQNRDMYRDGELVQKDWSNRLLTETFTQEAVRLIEQDKGDKPFFIYLPFTAPHFDADAHPSWDGHSANGAYGDVVEELDARVGEILDAIGRKGVLDNTIVIFTSDNGPSLHQLKYNSAAPFSGIKFGSGEGGYRVPAIVRYPGVVPAGATGDAMISAMDLYPTLARVCGIGIDLPKAAQKLDGMDVWDTLIGQEDGHPRTELLFWHGRGQATALRQGDWKVYFNAGTIGKHSDPSVKNGPVLFNLKQDPGEKKNLAKQHPGRVKAMLARAKELLKEVYENQVPLGVSTGGRAKSPPLRADQAWGKWLGRVGEEDKPY